MVRAILDGSKTMTRRVENLEIINIKPSHWSYPIMLDTTNGLFFKFLHIYDKYQAIKPRYQVGDHLWVRETWAGNESNQYFKADGVMDYKPCDFTDGGYPVTCREQDCESCEAQPFKWKPSLFMPKKYARLWLEVISVKCERLQDISEEYARKEGVKDRDSFIVLWQSLNGKKHPWEKNEWVFVYEFRRLEREK